MSDYSNITLSNLIELLAEKTRRYLQLREEGPVGIEYEVCKEEICQIQQAIESRKIYDMNETGSVRSGNSAS
jgi:hypothetical protein